jgi:hypothetical protein
MSVTTSESELAFDYLSADSVQFAMLRKLFRINDVYMKKIMSECMTGESYVFLFYAILCMKCITSSCPYISLHVSFPKLMTGFNLGIGSLRRSKWPRGLRHELSSSARTLGSWVRIPLEAWMSVCVYSVFVLFCA